MSEFIPNTRVRCIDCTKYSDGHCLVKFRQPSTSPRKRRLCSKYDFCGAYQNRTPLPAERLPFWYYYSNKERKILEQMINAGVQPLETKTIQVPNSTATSTTISRTESASPELAS